MGKTNEQLRSDILELLKEDQRLSIREIANITGKSKTNIVHHLNVLERNGLISRSIGKHRSIKVNDGIDKTVL